jgi:hypothetical protein
MEALIRVAATAEVSDLSFHHRLLGDCAVRWF